MTHTIRKLAAAFILALLAPLAFAQGAFAPAMFTPFKKGGGLSSGTAVSGCTSSILYADASSLLKCDPAAVVNGSVSTAGRSILTIRDTISGSSATSNFLNITGAFPATLSAETNALNVALTVDNDGQPQNAIKAATSGSGGAVDSAIRGVGGNTGTYSVGVLGETSAAATNAIGVLGYSAAGTNRVGGYFTLVSATPAPPSSMGLYVDNGAVASPVASFADNGTATSTTGASANVTILDGAQMRLGPMALTSSTMTPSIVSEARTVTHSYAWTNAMVTALGASTTGDVNVATLPAKTRVEMAYIVIDSPDSSANALTVGCGDTGAGAVNYVKAGDAKAAANTVYGDNITGSETGTSLFSTFFITNYVPSYTATTTVSCRFTKTTTNLNTVTGSTGRVILITSLLP